MAWEQERSGDSSAPWLGEVRDAIKESVPVPRKDFTLDRGPDKIVNFSWKRADTLHQSVSKSMQAIANKPQDIP